MNEKFGGIWVNFDNDDSSSVVKESYSESLDKLFVIYKRADGLYMSFSYVKKKSPQWSLPFWSNENSKVMLSSLVEAEEYLNNYGAIT